MTRIIMEGWEDGLEKTSLIKLQMEVLNLSLKQSKENVDRLLEGITVDLCIESADVAASFLKEATSIGVIAKEEP